MRKLVLISSLIPLACDPAPPADPDADSDTDGDGDEDDDDEPGDDSGPTPTDTATTTGATGDPPDPTADPTDDGGTSGDPETTTGPSADAPIILELSSNITTLQPGSVVRLTAIVTDPDGIEDVIGGSLTDESGSITYGALATASQEGAYTIELSWDEINVADALTFSGSDTRTFVATFFDTEANETTETIDLTFTCATEDGACGGECRSFESYFNCGGCDIVCGVDEACQAMECVQDLGPCHPLGEFGDCGSQGCHADGFGYNCYGNGSGTQGDACDGSNLCAEGFDCYTVGGGEASCFGYCDLDDPDCTGGTTCVEVMGVPMWDGTGLCA